MKRKKQKRFISWLLTMLLVLNVFLPAANVQADEPGAPAENVITISNDGDVASPSDATKPETSEEEGDGNTDVPLGTPSEGTKKDPVSASPPPVATPLNMGTLAIEPGLLEYSATVKVDGNTFTPDTNMTFPDGEKIDITFDFSKIPVLYGSNANTHVKPNDTARIVLGKGLKIIPGGAGPISLIAPDNIPVGSVTLSTEDGEVVADIAFDWTWGEGAGEVSEDTLNIKAGFYAGLEFDKSAAEIEDGKSVITILERKFYVNDPTIPTTYTVKKTAGTPNYTDKTIEWTVEITSQNPADADLSGFTFSDDLSFVGTYAGSFTVLDTPDATPAYTDSVLTYEFPAGTKAPKTITFKTLIPDSKFNSNNTQTVTNTAQLLDTADKKAGEDSNTATLVSNRWIKKSGKEQTNQSGNYDPTNRTIEWTITANEEMLNLSNVTIKDFPGTSSDVQGQDIVSAKYKLWTGSSWGADNVISDLTDFKANGLVLPSLNTKIQLFVVTSIPNDADGTVKSETYNNRATIEWTYAGVNGTATGTAPGVGIGYSAFEKSGSQVTGSSADRKINWTVSFDPKGQTQFGSTLTVYDLLVHGTSITNLEGLTGWPAGLSSANVTPQYNQRYVADSFSAVSGSATLQGGNAIELKDGTNVVAHLLVVEISGTAASSFKFESQVVNPTIFASNDDSGIVYNTATLINSSGKKLAFDDANVLYTSRILNKQILKHDSVVTDAGSVNGSNIGDADTGFDHKTKTAIFRLSINSDGLNFTDTSDINSGPVKVADTLPAGWVLDTSFNNNKGYKIFEGTGGADSVTATGPEITLNDMTAVFDPAAKPTSVSFTFNTLNKPYVILVKARLEDKTYEEYLKGNADSKTDINNSTLTVEKWSLTKTSTHGVTVKTKILNKSLVFDQVNATLTWTVDYNPFDLTLTDVKIEDTFTEGLELPLKSDGKPDWSKITITKMSMGENGVLAPQAGAGATVDPSTCITYNAAKRTLTFTVPVIGQAYRLTYVTDITLESNGSVNNSVKLVGSAADGANTDKSHQVTYQSGWASLQKGGRVEITKVDGFDSSPLADAQFTVYAQDGTTVIRQGETDINGSLKLRPIPVGTYILKETKAPNNYKPDVKTYQVVVREEGSTVVTSIDGGSNTITVENFQSNTVGDLTIRKTIAGNGAKTDDSFVFTVTFNAAGRYPYMGDGIPNGTIASGETISLKGGQSVTIYNIPNTAAYSVTEADYTGNGYDKPAITGDGATGTIGAGKTVTFTNTKILPGSLVISKTVLGSGADKTKKFNFTVTFNAEGSYSYSGAGVTNGTIKSGDTIALADGESITIIGLAPGTTYKVTEADYTSQRYSTASTNAEGTIISDSGITAAFTNTYRRPSSGGGGGGGGGNPKPPTNPTPTSPTPTPEPVNPGEVPQGYLQGPDGNYYTPQQLYDIFGQIPLGFMVGPNGMLVPLGGLPKTSDDVSRSVVVFGLLSISALLGMAVSVNNLRKKHSDE